MNITQITRDVECFFVEELEDSTGEIQALKFHTGVKTQDYTFLTEDVDIACISAGIEMEALLSHPGMNVRVLENLISRRYEIEKKPAPRLLISVLFFLGFMIATSSLKGQSWNWHYSDNTHELCDIVWIMFSVPQELTYKVAMHETGWGEFPNAPTAKSRNNWFGIGGDTNLRAYINKEESFFDFGKLMVSERYGGCQEGSVEDRLRCIQERGYNPDPSWVKLVNDLKVRPR